MGAIIRPFATGRIDFGNFLVLYGNLRGNAGREEVRIPAFSRAEAPIRERPDRGAPAGVMKPAGDCQGSRPMGVQAQTEVQKYTPQQLREHALAHHAVEAAIWGMPAVNYDLMLQEMLTKTKGRVGEAIYWGRPLDWKNQTLTPNPDALYFMVCFSTKDGPVVLDLPPGDENASFNANIVTVWQMPLEDAGLHGADQGKGGKYLILPPGYGNRALDGYIALQSDTFGGYMLFRV